MWLTDKQAVKAFLTTPRHDGRVPFTKNALSFHELFALLCADAQFYHPPDSR
jgi:hypothetical protein